jgi:hypothetical protein
MLIFTHIGLRLLDSRVALLGPLIYFSFPGVNRISICGNEFSSMANCGTTIRIWGTDQCGYGAKTITRMEFPW